MFTLTLGQRFPPGIARGKAVGYNSEYTYEWIVGYKIVPIVNISYITNCKLSFLDTAIGPAKIYHNRAD